jgi:hypothetical protein
MISLISLQLSQRSRNNDKAQILFHLTTKAYQGHDFAVRTGVSNRGESTADTFTENETAILGGRAAYIEKAARG